MKTIKYLFIMTIFLSVIILSGCNASSKDPQFLSPESGAEYVSPQTTIILRFGPMLNQQNVTSLQFDVKGAKSGTHVGKTILADDQKTVIFEPTQAFIPGEQVTVKINNLQINYNQTYGPISFQFNIASNMQNSAPAGSAVATSPPAGAFPNYLTLPNDIPFYTVTQTADTSDEGYIFVAPFYWTKSTLGSYLLILDSTGEIVYYQSVADDLNAFDFLKQPNGLLSYFDQKNGVYYLMDSQYKIVDSYQAANGYRADLHEFLLLPNGYAFIMANDVETVDLSNVVPGGKTDASVTGLVIQEMDPSKNVIFEWRSWDHIKFTDSTADLTAQEIDLIHGNAMDISLDGNLLLSSRNLSEITKIDLQTGDIIWRLGGKANQFKFVNDNEGFAFQHDVRQLPNGDITIFDNQGTTENPAPSRGIEYKVDEANMTATLVWSYTHSPYVFGTYMGDVQRMSNGNNFLGWGAAYDGPGYVFVSMTEVDPNNNVLLEITFDQPYVSYRAIRFPWHGYPDTLPDLAFRNDSSGLTLGYSWNGATEVASYQLYGGSTAQSLSLIDQKTKMGFETQTHLDTVPMGMCYFQVAAMDTTGKEMAHSVVISIDEVTCPISK
jgi:hypothetical protein